MRKFKPSYFQKLIIFVIILVFIDIVAGEILESFYSNSRSGLSFQENYIMNKTNQDIIIYGSSRASYHYIPSIISDSLNMSCYNAGREGSGIYYHYGVLLSTLKRYIPKIIILEIDIADIYDGGVGFSKEIVKEHYPFFNKISYEFDSLIITENYQRILILSNLYRYNTKIFQIVKGNAYTNPDNEEGFKSLTGEHKYSIKHFNSELNLDLDKIQCIEKFIKKSQISGSQIVLVVSPIYCNMPDTVFSHIASLAEKYNTTFLDYSSEQIFLSKASIFNDEFHLNSGGAKLFSSRFASDLYSIK